jgi:uncharacterized protein (TIGR03083 family)
MVESALEARASGQNTRTLMTHAEAQATLPQPLSIQDHIELLAADGRRFSEVVAGSAFAAAVPGCPEWDVEGLIRHLGDVHRWAATIVRDHLKERLRRDFAGPAGRDALLEWFAEGHDQLLEVLSAASPEDEAWTWAPAPSPLAFWARRQAHETAIHRLDAEQAGGTVTPFPALAAADGVDEWLTLASLRSRVPDGRGRRLHVAADDVRGEWVVTLRDDGLTVERGAAAGDCSVRASASDLFALLMNRCDASVAEVTGDEDVLRAWRESVRF